VAGDRAALLARGKPLGNLSKTLLKPLRKGSESPDGDASGGWLMPLSSRQAKARQKEFPVLRFSVGNYVRHHDGGDFPELLYDFSCLL
jgi:hypothetical protein